MIRGVATTIIIMYEFLKIDNSLTILNWLDRVQAQSQPIRSKNGPTQLPLSMIVGYLVMGPWIENYSLGTAFWCRFIRCIIQYLLQIFTRAHTHTWCDPITSYTISYGYYPYYDNYKSDLIILILNLNNIKFKKVYVKG